MSSHLNDIDDIDYSYKFLKSLRWIMAIVSIFILIIIGHIPIRETIDSLVRSGLQISSQCQIRFKDYHFELFAPKLVINNAHVPEGCTQGKIPGGIKLNEAKVYFRGISFSPFGLSTKMLTSFLGHKIEAFIIPSFSSLNILIENQSEKGKFISDINKISLNKISHYIPMIKVSGDVYLSDIALSMSYGGQIQDLAINIASDNLHLPAQQILLPSPFGLGDPLPFNLESMPINSLLIQIIGLKDSKLVIKKFILGDENSPIKARLLGDIKLNTGTPGRSALNLKTEIGFSKEFSDKLPIDMLFGKYDKKDNFYQIQIKGALSKPQLSSP